MKIYKITEASSLLAVPAQRFFTIRQASRYTGLNASTLRKMTDLGELRARRVGKRRMFTIEDLNSWIDGQPLWYNDSHGVNHPRS